MKSKIHEKKINTNCFQRLLSCTLKLQSRLVQPNKKNCTLKITTQKKERKINYTKTIQLCLNNMKYKYSANKKSHISPVMDKYIIIIITQSSCQIKYTIY